MGFLHCFGLLLLFCWFPPLLQSFFAEDIFCNSDHPCYFSLGTFQLIHSTQEAWYSNLDNVFQPRSYWHCLELKDYSQLHMPVQHLPFFCSRMTVLTHVLFVIHYNPLALCSKFITDWFSSCFVQMIVLT